ncbi:MAG: head-tail adaptor protein [Caldilineaceae bacterium]
MQTGRLRHRVTLQTGKERTGAFGTEVQVWEPGDTIYAEVRSQVGSDAKAPDEQIFPTVTYLVTIRYRPGLSQKMRLIWGNRYLLVHDARELDNRMRLLQLICREQLADPGLAGQFIDLSDANNSQALALLFFAEELA